MIKIAVIGDSMSAQSYLWEPLWPQCLDQILRQNNIDCEVRAFAVNAHTFFRLNNTQSHRNKTAVQAALEYNPDVCIVVCGYNDTVSDQDSRTIAQVQEDALETFTALRAQSNTRYIVYGAQVPYDQDNFTTNTVKNKGLPGDLWTLNTSGILQDTWTDEIEETAASSTVRNDLADWETLDTYIKSLPLIDGSFDLPTWKVARLGFHSPDGLHYTAAGHRLLGGTVAKELRTLADSVVTDNTNAPYSGFMKFFVDQLINEWEDANDLFDDILTDSADGYTLAWPNLDGAPTTLGNLLNNNIYSPEIWYLPYKATFNLFPLTVTNDTTTSGQFSWEIRNGPPNTAVELSVADGAFSALNRQAGGAVVTDARGNASDIAWAGNIGLGNGTYNFRWRVAVGDSKYQCFPVQSVTFTA